MPLFLIALAPPPFSFAQSTRMAVEPVVEIGPRLVAREDEDVSEAITGFLTKEGVDILCNANCLSVAKAGSDIVMRLDCGDGAREARGSHLLIATGRRPNTDDLGLERAGVRRDARVFIEVDDELRTSVPGIWALGDCNVAVAHHGPREQRLQ